MLADAHIENHIAVRRERRFRISRDGNNFDGKALDGRQQIQQLLGLAGITQREDEIAVIDNSQIAVQRVHAVEDHAGGTGARERGRNFLADVARFANADHDDFSAPPQRLHNHLHRGAEGAIQLRAHFFQRGDFDGENILRFGEIVHRAEDAANPTSFQ